ncbi:merozoite surface antigen 2, allelic form 2 isoform X2 [Anopheles aquasalis]|uniref:merozoite surface antigen 2, allelic form 2 isoform X2 n=1 Tax=Anopheles aquasalis TaxID=42839 RepID=UPI00215B396F|nr:merozoite surface antigen 2, allelic form 2 isoform X2 [Anopheles aquasalis]
MRAFIAIALLMLVQCVLTVPVPQFLTFRDGKFGVNFGGYHAEAGLGGLLTGNSAHGGLSASAGTPYGQQAGAGLGGIVGGNERTAGGAYAGATAGSGVGASAAIGGGLDGVGAAGGVGAESHAGGLSKKVVKLGQTNGAAPPTEVVISKEHGHGGNFERIDNREYHKEVHTEVKAPPAHPAPAQHGFHKTVYKKKVISHPHKIHTRLDSSNGHSAGGASTSTHVVASSTHNSNFWNDIFNIPISTLSAVNQFLNNKSGSGSVHVEKHVEVH